MLQRIFPSYYRHLVRMAWRDPQKIPSMMRLKLARRDNIPPPPGQRVPPPLVIAVRPTYNCNLRCLMCNQWGENGVFMKWPKRFVRREMTTQDFKDFFDEVSSFKPYIYFTGGEPLLAKDTLELIRYASSRHLVTSMSTNSTLLQDKAEEVIRSGLDYIYLSLDAPAPCDKEVIRRQVNRQDSNQRAVDSIRHLLELRDELGIGLPVVQIQTIIVKENQYKLLEMAHFVEDVLQPDVWGLQLCVHTTPELSAATTRIYQENFGQDQVGWEGFVRVFTSDMNFEEISWQLETIMSSRWKFKLRIYSPTGLPGFDLRRYYLEPERDSCDLQNFSCMNPYVFAQLQPNGDIAFCGSQPDYIVGNVKQHSFLDVWNSKRAQKWRHFLQKHSFPVCKRCFSLHEYQRFTKS